MSWYSEKIQTSPLFGLASRSDTLELLYPPFAVAIITLFARARSEGLPLVIYETYRSQARQLELFNKGATKLSKNGMHHFGVACDIVFLTPQGNPSWAATNNWSRLGQIGQGLALEWGGAWSGFVDQPHFQLIPATKIAQAQIIAENYPAYPAALNTKCRDLLALYAEAKAKSFSASQIAKIIAFLDGGALAPAPAPLFIRTLKEGMKGADVLLLQKVLNTDPATRIATQGPGSPDNESNFFGTLTKKAVQKFQIKHGITTPASSAFGTAGPRTRKTLEAVAIALHVV